MRTRIMNFLREDTAILAYQRKRKFSPLIEAPRKARDVEDTPLFLALFWGTVCATLILVLFKVI